jgi:hypothetical protein
LIAGGLVWHILHPPCDCGTRFPSTTKLQREMQNKAR